MPLFGGRASGNFHPLVGSRVLWVGSVPRAVADPTFEEFSIPERAKAVQGETWIGNPDREVRGGGGMQVILQGTRFP